MSFLSPCTRWGKRNPAPGEQQKIYTHQKWSRIWSRWSKRFWKWSLTVCLYHSQTNLNPGLQLDYWDLRLRWKLSKKKRVASGLEPAASCPTVSSAWEWQKTKRVAETSLSHIVTQWRELLKITSAATFPLVGKTIVKKHFVLNVSTSMEWKYQISTLHLIPILSQFYVWKFQLALNRNPWRCDCHLRPFREWLAIQVFRN